MYAWASLHTFMIYMSPYLPLYLRNPYFLLFCHTYLDILNRVIIVNKYRKNQNQYSFKKEKTKGTYDIWSNMKSYHVCKCGLPA